MGGVSMMTWFLNIGHKFAGIVIFLTQIIVHWEDILDRFSSVLGLKKLIERRHNKMSLASVINGIALAEKDALALSAFMAKLPTYLPEIQKQLGDLQKAMADKSDPTAEIADVSALLNDLNTDLSTVVPMVQNLLPSLATQAPTTTTPAAS